MAHLPLTTFHRCVARYDGKHEVKQFTCLDQYLCMAFAQLTCRESLRDMEACLRSQSKKLYHMGFRSTVARNTMANANAVRDWRIYADFAQSRPQPAQEPTPVSDFVRPFRTQPSSVAGRLSAHPATDWLRKRGFQG
jgi:hypothetical protein